MIDRLLTSPVFKIVSCGIPLLVFVVLAAFSFDGREAMVACYAKTSFFLIFTLFILWAIHLGRYLGHRHWSVIGFVRFYGVGISVALIVTLVIFYTVPVYLKILNDETNLLAVSQSMFHYQDANRITMATFPNGALHVVRFDVPIRPLLFPFLTCLVHFVLGYHFQNVFILNFILTFAFLAGVYVCARHFTDAFASCGAIFLVASYPLFSICAASGGYDLLSTCFFYLALVLLYQYLRSPDPVGFAFLWVTLLMLANVRNESIVLFLMMALGAVMATRRLYVRQLLRVYTLTPLLLLPYLWQRILSAGEYENPENVALFSVGTLADHLWILIQNFLNVDLFLPYAGLLNGLAVGLLLYLVGQAALKKLSLDAVQVEFWWIFGLCLIAHTAISLAHFMGMYDHPAQARFFLNLSVACAIVPVLFQSVYPNRIPGKVLLLGSLVMFAIYHPIAVKHEFVDALLVSRTHRAESLYLKQMNDRKVLVLSAYPSQFSAFNYSSLSIRYANHHFREIKDELGHDRYSKVIAFQHISTQTQVPVFETQVFAPQYKLRPLKSVEVLPNVVLRISEVSFE